MKQDSERLEAAMSKAVSDGFPQPPPYLYLVAAQVRPDGLTLVDDTTGLPSAGIELTVDPADLAKISVGDRWTFDGENIGTYMNADARRQVAGLAADMPALTCGYARAAAGRHISHHTATTSGFLRDDWVCPGGGGCGAHRQAGMRAMPVAVASVRR